MKRRDLLQNISFIGGGLDRTKLPTLEEDRSSPVRTQDIKKRDPIVGLSTRY